MKFLKIKSTGLLDIRLVYLMGGTTKSDDKYKIGQFGTGLKYTLAYLVRSNILFKIFIGGKEVEISSKKETIRDTEFEIIYINKDRSSITTNMGLDWEAWMIIRELWCNALDEENPEFCETEVIEPENSTTEFYIQLTGDIQKVYENWNKYFIHNQIPIMQTDKFAIYDGGETLRCYKQGVLIKEIEGKKAVFSYDIKDTPLNELREMKYLAQTEILECIPFFTKEVVEIFLTRIKDTYEDTIEYSGYFGLNNYSEGWKNAIGSSKIVSYKTYEKLVDKYPNLENEPIIQIPESLFKKLCKQFKGISLTRASNKLNEFYETYTDKLNDKIKKCLSILESVGYFIDPELKILTGVFGRKDVLGQINYDSKEIYLNQDLENMSDSELIVVLIEENEHYKTGLEDCTRGFQSHFVKLYANLLLKNVNVLL